jgi:hypothetical protein
MYHQVVSTRETASAINGQFYDASPLMCTALMYWRSFTLESIPNCTWKNILLRKDCILQRKSGEARNLSFQRTREKYLLDTMRRTFSDIGSEERALELENSVAHIR